MVRATEMSTLRFIFWWVPPIAWLTMAIVREESFYGRFGGFMGAFVFSLNALEHTSTRARRFLHKPVTLKSLRQAKR